MPTGDTDPVVVTALSSFVDRQLGKGVVVAKDTPNFIANRIGLYGVTRVLEQLSSGHYTIEEIDAMTGPVVESSPFLVETLYGSCLLMRLASPTWSSRSLVLASMHHEVWAGGGNP